MEKFGLFISRQRAAVITTWLLLTAFAVAVAQFGLFTGESIAERLSGGNPQVAGEAATVSELLATEESASTEAMVLAVYGFEELSPELQQSVGKLETELNAHPVVDTIISPLAAGSLEAAAQHPSLSRLVADDGRGLVLQILVMVSDNEDVDNSDTIAVLLDDWRESTLDAFPELTISPSSLNHILTDLVTAAEHDIIMGELISLPVALLILVLVFGGFLAAGLPIIGAITAILSGLGALFVTSYGIEIESFVLNVLTVIGLGLSIDYGLLIVSRFREEYRKQTVEGLPHSQVEQRANLDRVIATTLGTAGKTVVFSGLIIATAAASLFLFESNLFRAIGAGAVIAVVLAILTAITLVPAILGVAGVKISTPGPITKIPGLRNIASKLGDSSSETGGFAKIGALVQRHAVIITIAGLGILILIGSQVFGLKLTSNFLDSLPANTSQGQHSRLMSEHFSDFKEAEVLMVSQGSEQQHESWTQLAGTSPDVLEIVPASQINGFWVSEVKTVPERAEAVVAEIRSERPVQFDNWVGGSAASTADFNDALLRDAPWAALLIFVVSFVLIFLMTGSLIVPLKALLIGVLSLTASLGVLVWGFEDGNLAQLLNFNPEDVPGIYTLVLVLALTFGFGLAVDYELFLLSRIKEARDSGQSNRQAIITGLHKSGRIITSAALVIVVVFIGFTFGDLMQMKQLGVALAVTVTLDATLVRIFLVPAAMTLMGEWQWKLPKLLRGVYERYAIKE